jgi:ABC-2 type transport system permease protein
MRYARAWSMLVFTSFRRMLWSVGTLMLLFPLAACALFVARRGFVEMRDPVVAFNAFSNFLLFVFGPLIVPLCALAFGTSSIGADREDRTLLFLLIRPLPRWLILSAKLAAALPLAVGFACGSFYLLARLAGPGGRMAFDAYLPAMLYMTVAYTALFQLFAVIFRHSVVVSLLYAIFMEVFLGNVPGIIKQLAISYYGRSVMFDAGVAYGLSAPDPQWFDPLSSDAARWILGGVTLAAMLVAWVVFAWREYDEESG